MAGDEIGTQEQERAGGAAAREPRQQATQEPLTSGGADAAGASTDYGALLAERDAKIAVLEGAIAEAAEALRAEMDELRRQGEEQRVEFELTMAGARNVRAARALLDEHGGDVSKLKEAEPWLFEGAAPRQGGKTGLPNAGAASDEGKTMKRWREIAGVADEEWQMANSNAYTKNYTAVLDEVYKRAACSTCLNSPRRMARAGRNAKEIMVPKIEVTSLVDYTRNVGYKTGSITYEFETKTFNYDRGIKLLADVMDVEEAGVLDCFVAAGSELQRTQVAPEADAFTFAEIAGHEGVSAATTDYTDAEAEDVLADLRAATNAMDEAQVTTGSRYLFITPTLRGVLDDFGLPNATRVGADAPARFLFSMRRARPRATAPRRLRLPPEQYVVRELDLHAALVAQPREVRAHGAAHEHVLLEGHPQAVVGKDSLEDALEGARLGAQPHDLLGNLVHLVDVELRQLGDVLRGGRVGGDEHPGGEALHHLERPEVGRHVVDEADLVLLERLPAREAVGEKHNVVGGAIPHHVKEVARELEGLEVLRERACRQGLRVALLRHEELVPEVAARVAPVEKRGLQLRASRERALDARRKDAAARLALQVAVAADVVSV